MGPEGEPPPGPFSLILPDGPIILGDLIGKLDTG